MKIYFEKKKLKSMQACIHFPSKANLLAVYLKEICNCVVSARKEFHTIEMQFSNWKEKNPRLFWPFFLIMKKQNSCFCQIKAWAVLKFSCNKPTRIHLMFLYKEHCWKGLFLHHIHHSASVCACYPKGRVHPGLHQKQGGQQVREMILLW